jgi:hypothetical protein
LLTLQNSVCATREGITADRELVQVDTEQAHAQLINSRMAYVSVSRGPYDAQIQMNDAGKLGEELNREVSKQSAMEPEHDAAGRGQDYLIASAEQQSEGDPHEHGHMAYSVQGVSPVPGQHRDCSASRRSYD